tara:strand:- start:86 stop:244 length:159 start_codon:yes stop_codon:yes gene_type:complete
MVERGTFAKGIYICSRCTENFGVAKITTWNGVIILFIWGMYPGYVLGILGIF